MMNLMNHILFSISLKKNNQLFFFLLSLFITSTTQIQGMDLRNRSSSHTSKKSPRSQKINLIPKKKSSSDNNLLDLIDKRKQPHNEIKCQNPLYKPSNDHLLVKAIKANNPKEVQLALKTANPNIKDSETGDTPLILAIKNLKKHKDKGFTNAKEILRLLLLQKNRFSVDLMATNQQGESPLAIAQKNKMSITAQMLKDVINYEQYMLNLYNQQNENEREASYTTPLKVPNG